MEKKRIVFTLFFLVLILTNKALAVVRPPSSFGKAVEVQVFDKGGYKGIRATNLRGETFQGVWREADGRYYASTSRHFHPTGTTGAKAAGSIPGTISQTVTKPPVLKGLLKSAIKGGATFGKITPAGIAKSLIVERAFSLVAEKLAEQEFEWSDEHQNFVNDKEYTVECRNINTPNAIANDKSKNYGFTPCGGISATVKNMPDVVNAVMTSICQNQPDPNHTFVGYSGDFNNGTCNGYRNPDKPDDLYWYVNVQTKLNSSRAITQAEFDDIIGTLMDANPTPYIEASADESGNIPGISEPQILILDGSLVQSAPYTNPQTGQAEQASWRFSTSGAGDNAQTSVTETITPRPDLKPYSPEAPAVETPVDPKPEEDDKKQQQSEGLCEQYPDILACDKQPEGPSASAPAFHIPTEEIPLTFEPDGIFPDNGTCPAPVSFDVSIPFSGSRTFAFEYTHICDTATRIRGIVIALAWLAVALLATKAIKVS